MRRAEGSMTRKKVILRRYEEGWMSFKGQGIEGDLGLHTLPIASLNFAKGF